MWMPGIGDPSENRAINTAKNTDTNTVTNTCSCTDTNAVTLIDYVYQMWIPL